MLVQVKYHSDRSTRLLVEVGERGEFSLTYSSLSFLEFAKDLLFNFGLCIVKLITF